MTPLVVLVVGFAFVVFVGVRDVLDLRRLRARDQRESDLHYWRLRARSHDVGERALARQVVAFLEEVEP